MTAIAENKIVGLYSWIETINLRMLPVMTRDRSISRKEQAKLARDLFKRLGLKGISVTVPNYSMAQSVHVSVPRLPREDGDFMGYETETFSDMPETLPGKIKMRQHGKATDKILAILQVVFPEHTDRSDSQSDHFDYCWSID